MQRSTTALLVILAIFAFIFPAVDARATGLRRSETNAERLRRGEALLPPVKLRRNDDPSRVEASKRYYPSGTPASWATVTGPVQCRGSDNKTIGYINYINDTLAVTRGSTAGVSSSLYPDGRLEFAGGQPDNYIVGAPTGLPIKKDSNFSVVLNGTSVEKNAIIWSINSPTGKLTPKYKTSWGSLEVSIDYNATTGLLSLSGDLTPLNNTVTLYLT